MSYEQLLKSRILAEEKRNQMNKLGDELSPAVLAIREFIVNFHESLKNIEESPLSYRSRGDFYEVQLVDSRNVKNRYSILHNGHDVDLRSYVDQYDSSIDLQLDGGHFIVRYEYDGGGIESWNSIIMLIRK